MRQNNKITYRKIQLPFKIKKAALSLGSQTKNTVCFARGRHAYLSSIHSDLSNPQDFLSFEKDTKYFLKKNPQIIAYDLHPEYQSTKYALNLHAIRHTPYAIQHHHAHIASCMVDNGLKNQKVIGVAFDGTGLGTDNTLWGAEFLICDYKNFKRKARLRQIPLLGGQQAILEPWRLAAAWLYLTYKERIPNLKVNFLKGINKSKWKILKDMYLKEVGSPLASSMGRLFDAIASIVLEKYEARFEAELAIGLEKLAIRYPLSAIHYPFRIIRDKDIYILDPLPIFRQVIGDLKRRMPEEKIAYRFHLTVAEMIRKACLILRKDSKINKVVLSGGVFQNNLLLRQSLDLLYKEDFGVFINKNLAYNDSSVSLGQVTIANFRS